MTLDWGEIAISVILLLIGAMQYANRRYAKTVEANRKETEKKSTEDIEKLEKCIKDIEIRIAAWSKPVHTAAALADVTAKTNGVQDNKLWQMQNDIKENAKKIESNTAKIELITKGLQRSSELLKENTKSNYGMQGAFETLTKLLGEQINEKK